MDFCTTYFGKSIHQLDLSDIRKFFNKERIETDQLEFKSINPNGSISEKYIGIQRTVCAFLNSSGGLLIWGAPVGKSIKGQKGETYCGEPTFLTEKLEKDSLISKISDNIIPLPNNIKCQILAEGSMSMVIIEVSSSEYSPHQTRNTYYMRIDGQSKPAPHHYIEALFKRIKYPNIEAYVAIDKLDFRNTLCRIQCRIELINWSPLQNEEKLTYRIDANMKVTSNARGFYLFNSEQNYVCENVKDVFHFGESVSELFCMEYDRRQSWEIKNKGILIISFGGRYSPMKVCMYEIDLTKINSDDPNDMMVSIHENRLLRDIQDEKGQNKKSIIDSLLKFKG